MKRTITIIFVLLLTAVMLLSFSACGKKEPPKTEPKITDAVELLNTVWASYGDNEKFSAAGGDADNTNMGGPGKYGVENKEMLDYILGLPESAGDKVDGAASLMHMMNANTFTCGAFHLVKAEDAADVAAALKDNIMDREWMCGFPDKLIVVSVEDYIVSAFGNEELINTFRDKLAAAYPEAKTVCDENIF